MIRLNSTWPLRGVLSFLHSTFLFLPSINMLDVDTLTLIVMLCMSSSMSCSRPTERVRRSGSWPAIPRSWGGRAAQGTCLHGAARTQEASPSSLNRRQTWPGDSSNYCDCLCEMHVKMVKRDHQYCLLASKIDGCMYVCMYASEVSCS